MSTAMVSRWSRRRSQKGFTLLEAVVAIAVLAAGASALYAWVNTNLKTLQRVDAITERAALIESAAELVSAIDPLTQPEGEMALGAAKIRWRTEKPAYQGATYADDGSLGINDASLFAASIEIWKGERRIAEFDMWLLGIQKGRELGDVLFN